MAQSPDIGQNPDEGISNFRLSGRSFIKEDYHNSRTSDDTDMKLGPVTKLDMKSKAPSKKCDYNIMAENYDLIVIFPLYGQFGAIQKADSRRIVYKTCISLIVTFYLTKTENRTKISLPQISHYCYE